MQQAHLASRRHASKQGVRPWKNRTVLLVGCSALLAIAVAVATAVFLRPGRRELGGGEDRASKVRSGWRYENRDSLIHLSAIGTMSRQERARLDAAGNDPERTRQVMLAIHEDRMMNANLDLLDAQRRKAQMQGSGGYKAYANRPQGRDPIELVNEDERVARSQIAQYAAGLGRIRAWKPDSYETYAAGSMLPGGDVAWEPGPTVAETPRKPDAGVPVSSAPVLAEPTRPPAAEQNTSAGDLESGAAGKPTMTVYASDERGGGAGRDAETEGSEKAEEEIQETLRLWSGAMVLNDPKVEAAEYAPHMDRYFLRKDVDKAFVEADKAAYLRRGNVTAAFALQGVTIESQTDKTADVRLVKDVTWRHRATGETHQMIRSRLQLTRLESGWKISGEQDFR